MKTSSIIGLLIGAAVLVPAGSINAQTPSTTPSPTVAIARAVTPFELVTMAYQGFFEREGIAAGNEFVDQYENEQIAAKDLVQVAIQTNRLPADILTNQQYLHDVDTQLTAFIDLDR